MRTPSRRKTAVAVTHEWAVVTIEGESCVEELTKHGLVQRTGLSPRDLRVVDPVLSYPSSILGRDRAIVVNLEHIKAVVTASEVLLSNPNDPSVEPVQRELESRLARGGQDSMNYVSRRGRTKPLPFEFRALEICLELASKRLETETLALEKEAYPALDELSHNVSTLNLERVRQIKSRLVGITSRAQKMRDELEHLLEDDVDMTELHLSEKLMYQASVVSQSSRSGSYKHSPQSDNKSDGEHYEEDEVEPEIEEMEVENENEGETAGFKPDLDQLEMLLEAYFVQSEGVLNKLTTVTKSCIFLHEFQNSALQYVPLRDYVDDTEDYINMMLDDKQNQLLQMGVMLSTAIMILNISIALVGALSMNIKIPLFEVPPSLTFWEITGGVAGGTLGLHVIILVYFKKTKLF